MYSSCIMIIILMHIKLVHLSHFFKEFVVQYMSVLCHCSFVESITLYNYFVYRSVENYFCIQINNKIYSFHVQNLIAHDMTYWAQKAVKMFRSEALCRSTVMEYNMKCNVIQIFRRLCRENIKLTTSASESIKLLEISCAVQRRTRLERESD